MAKLEFFHGVMGSGKGVFVAQMAHNTRSRGLEPITMKPGTDTKAGENIVSRVGMVVPVDILAAQEDKERSIGETNVYSATLAYIGQRAASSLHLIVDEVQFFSPDQVEQLYALAHRKELPVTAFGLKADVYRNLFAGSARLIALADRVAELQTAVRCAGCTEKPNQNGRYINGVFDIDPSRGVVKIDGADDDIVYDVFCNDCYDKEVVRSSQGLSVTPSGI
jgi:thymidine kinase